LTGENLRQSRVLQVDFGDHEYVLFRASQKSADVVLTLKDMDNDEIVKTISFSAHKGLDEYLLVTVNDCDQCSVELSSASPIDKDSDFSIEKAFLFAETDTILKAKISAYTKITAAAQDRYFADHSKGAIKTQHLRDSAKNLTEAANVSRSFDDSIYLHCQTLLAETLYFAGEKDKQISILEEIKAKNSSIDGNYYTAQAWYELGAYEPDFKKKRAMFAQGIDIAERIENDQLAAMGNNYNAVNLIYDGEYQSALSLLSSAEETYKKAKNHRELVKVLFNLSWGNQRAGNQAAALAYASKLKSLAEKYDDKEEALWAAYNMASIYSQAGVYFEAEKILDESLDQFSELDVSPNSSLASLQANLLQEKGELLLHFGNYDAAQEHIDKTIQKFQNLSYKERLTNLYFLSGEVAFALGDLEYAERKISESLRSAESNNQVRQSAKAKLALADLKISQGRYEEAFVLNQKVLASTPTSADGYLKTRAVRQKMEVLQLQKKNALALEYAALKEESFDKGRVHEYAKFRFIQGRAFYGIGDLEQAKRTLRLSRNIIDQSLDDVKREDLRRIYLALHRSIYELSIEVENNVSKNDAKGAILLAEAFNARTLLENIRSSQLGLPLSPNIKQKRDDVVQRIQREVAEWYRQKSEGQKKSHLKRIKQGLEDLQVFNAETGSAVVSTPLKEGLDPPVHAEDGRLIAYYFLGEYESWLWVITKDTVGSYKLPKREELDKILQPLIFTYSVPPTSRSNISAWDQKKMLAEASEILLHPLTSYLKEERVEHITIVPSGALHGAPFAALSVKGSDKPIMWDYSLSLVSSLASLNLLENESGNWFKDDHPITLLASNPIPNEASGLPTEQLHYSSQETEAISRILGSNVTAFSGAQATKQTLLDHLNQPHEILHLATHGVVNMAEPALSGLVLSSGSSEESSIWSTSEIGSAKIEADLVILSACEGSIGPLIPGEGLFSLSRAFIEGGAQSVIGTLWKVQDDNAAKIMEYFYSYLVTDRMSVVEALSQSQRSIYKNAEEDWRDPYYWAGFTLHGANLEPVNE